MVLAIVTGAHGSGSQLSIDVVHLDQSTRLIVGSRVGA
jgi:hypothetical protein